MIVLAVVVFVLISGLLARVFSLSNAEQAAVTDLVAAEAHGQATQVVAKIQGCAASPACRAGAQRDAAALRHAGAVQIAQYTPSAGFSLGSTTGIARVAWTAGGSKPIVQCVEIHRAGNVLTGQSIELLKLSPRINGGANCPAKL